MARASFELKTEFIGMFLLSHLNSMVITGLISCLPPPSPPTRVIRWRRNFHQTRARRKANPLCWWREAREAAPSQHSTPRPGWSTTEDQCSAAQRSISTAATWATRRTIAPPVPWRVCPVHPDQVRRKSAPVLSLYLSHTLLVPSS